MEKALPAYLETLRLIPHPNKAQVHQTSNDIPFLGFQVFPFHRYVRKEKVKRYRRHLKKTLQLRALGRLDPETLENKLNAWLGHIQFGQSKRLKYAIFWYLRDAGVELFHSASGSWRVLEQQR